LLLVVGVLTPKKRTKVHTTNPNLDLLSLDCGVKTMKWAEWIAVADDEARWLNHDEKGLLKAEYVKDYVIRLWFEEELDVSIYELDFYPLVVSDNPGGVFAGLRDKEQFSLIKGDYALIWLNPQTGEYDEQAIDIAPECIRFFCQRYGKELKSPAKEVMV
jgi:hypothetical protein